MVSFVIHLLVVFNTKRASITVETLLKMYNY
jgi:hypothetical protein